MVTRAVVGRAFIGGQLLPARDGGVPGGALRGVRTAGEIFERGVVGRDQAGARAAFDRHVADRHALFHGERADRAAGVFEDAAGAAADADLRDQREDDVLGGDAGLQRAVHLHLEGLRLALQQALRGQHVLHFAGADAEGQRAERAVRGRVAVAADHGHAGLRESQFRPDHVHDALLARCARRGSECRTRCSWFRAARAAWRRSRRRWAASGRVVGMLWSAVAMVRSGRRTLRPRSRRPWKACGEVTSWTRCRSMNSSVGAPGCSWTTWESQSFSMMVRGISHTRCTYDRGFMS